jgi:hypothetical protein
MATNVLGAALALLADRRNRIDAAIAALSALAEAPADARHVQKLLQAGHVDAEIVRPKRGRPKEGDRKCENPECPNGFWFTPKRGDSRFCSKQCQSHGTYLKLYAERASKQAAREAKRDKAGLNGAAGERRAAKAARKAIRSQCKDCKRGFMAKPLVAGGYQETCADCIQKTKERSLAKARAVHYGKPSLNPDKPPKEGPCVDCGKATMWKPVKGGHWNKVCADCQGKRETNRVIKARETRAANQAQKKAQQA